MKKRQFIRTISLLLVLTTVLFVSGCAGQTKGGNEQSSFVPDITIGEIDWAVSSGTLNGENYVLGNVTNNSNYIIRTIMIQFTENENIDLNEKEAFYADIQKAQGFDDKWLSEKISNENILKPLSMTMRYNKDLAVGESAEKIECYYLGGWTSKNVQYADLFVPETVEIHYEKEGKAHILFYGFETKSYELVIKA